MFEVLAVGVVHGPGASALFITESAVRVTRSQERDGLLLGELSRINMISSHVIVTWYFSLTIAIALATLNSLKITQLCCCMIETSWVPPRKSSGNFGNRRKLFGKCSETFL